MTNPKSIISLSANNQIEYEFVDNIDVSGLSDGLHQLNLRAKDKANTWSSLISYPFIKTIESEFSTNQITEYQYWVDGQNFQSSGILDPSITIVFLEDIDLTQLERGLHTIYLRFKDETGGWSAAIQYKFFYDGIEIKSENFVSGYRYWFRDNTEPIFTSAAGQDGLVTFNDEQEISESLPAGESVLVFQAQDANGLWSGPITENLDIPIPTDTIYDCPELSLNIGDPCDDGDTGTENDTITPMCDCVGETIFASLTGSADWINACGTRGMTIAFYETGTLTLVELFNTTIGEDGTYSIVNVPLGTFDIFVKIDGNLQSVYPNEVMTNGPNNLALGTLIPGDLNGDNGINIVDFSVINIAFGSIDGAPNYDPLADMNCDGGVNIVDFSILNASFGMTGDSPGAP